jgi:hypothetical protein
MKTIIKTDEYEIKSNLEVGQELDLVYGLMGEIIVGVSTFTDHLKNHDDKLEVFKNIESDFVVMLNEAKKIAVDNSSTTKE